MHGGRFGEEVVADAIRQYYRGLTYREAAEYVMRQYHIENTTHTKVAASTIRSWVRTCTDAAARRTEPLRVSVGDIWFLEGSMMAATRLQCWQVIDCSSRYIIAMDCLAEGKEESLPSEVMDKAVSSARARPNVLVCRSTLTDESVSSEIFRTIKKGFPETKVMRSRQRPELRPAHVRPDGCLYEKRNIADKLRKFKTPEDVQLFVRGWRVSYNFIEYKPRGIAPPGLSVAENVPFSSWTDVVGAKGRK